MYSIKEAEVRPFRAWIFIIPLLVTMALGVSSVNAQNGLEEDSLSTTWDEMYRFFDEPVDPDIYLIRPGEELTVTFIAAKISPIKLIVNPEGKIVHQTLGIFDLSEKTLTQARVIIGEAVTSYYSAEKFVIDISMPHRIMISVSGAVAKPGMYKAYTSHRVSEIIEAAGSVKWNGSTRRIVFLGGPSPLRVDLDLVKYAADNSFNPCLYAGVSILVPDISAERVQVIGEVNRPREIELISGDDLELLIKLSGGFRNSANPDSVHIAHGLISEPAPGDVIVVPGQKNIEEFLTLFGAVANPGQYACQNELSVKKLIEMSGGFLPNTNKALITVFRQAGLDEWGRISRIRYPISRGIGAGSDMMQMNLQPSDSIFVPFLVGYISVSGEILNPGRLPYIAGKDAMYYINVAGGFLSSADRDRVDIYNRVSKTTVSFSPRVLVHDGDELIINIKEELR